MNIYLFDWCLRCIQYFTDMTSASIMVRGKRAIQRHLWVSPRQRRWEVFSWIGLLHTVEKLTGILENVHSLNKKCICLWQWLLQNKPGVNTTKRNATCTIRCNSEQCDVTPTEKSWRCFTFGLDDVLIQRRSHFIIQSTTLTTAGLRYSGISGCIR